jgi:putative Mg2+ transporter-C (MgtC) family protein
MISPEETIIRLLLGTIMGGLIGYERQVHGRPAGFRTHMLVCVASVLIMIVSEFYYYRAAVDPTFIRIDPARIAAGAITGIGFLGAGVIVKMGATVTGLTTAACLWMVSAIGLSVGAGLYLASGVGFVLTFFALLVMRALEKRMATIVFRTLSVTASGDLREEGITPVLEKHGISILSTDYEKDSSKGEVTFRMSLAMGSVKLPETMLDELSSIANVKKVSFRD